MKRSVLTVLLGFAALLAAVLLVPRLSLPPGPARVVLWLLILVLIILAFLRLGRGLRR